MLNGRVYGASRQKPTAEIPAATKEPEFVEWGYGGMGSIAAAESAGSSAYSKVQSSNRNTVAGVSAASEDDDGSGMGWVRRRREAREREKALKPDPQSTPLGEPDEVVDAHSTPTASRSHTPPISDSPLSLSPRSISGDLDHKKTNPPPLTKETSQRGSIDESSHVYRAITLPPPRNSGSRPTSSRQSTEPKSGMSTPMTVRSLSNADVKPSPLGRRSIDSLSTLPHSLPSHEPPAGSDTTRSGEDEDDFDDSSTPSDADEEDEMTEEVSRASEFSTFII